MDKSELGLNPKDGVGSRKPPLSPFPAPVLVEVGAAMLEGALKYGRHNGRAAPVRASVYYDAALRHLFAWFEGEDIDPDSGVHHVSKAIATLAVLRDAQIRGTVVDERPPGTPDVITRMQPVVDALLEKYPDPVPPVTAGGKVQASADPGSYAEMSAGHYRCAGGFMSDCDDEPIRYGGTE